MDIKVTAHYIKKRDDKKKLLEGSLAILLPEIGIHIKNVVFFRVEDRFIIVQLEKKHGIINNKPCKYTTVMFDDFNKHKKFERELQLVVSIYLCEKVLKTPLTTFEYFKRPFKG